MGREPIKTPRKNKLQCSKGPKSTENAWTNLLSIPINYWLLWRRQGSLDRRLKMTDKQPEKTPAPTDGSRGGEDYCIGSNRWIGIGASQVDHHVDVQHDKCPETKRTRYIPTGEVSTSLGDFRPSKSKSIRERQMISSTSVSSLVASSTTAQSWRTDRV